MSHPLIWPSKYFFYGIGNTSAVSLTMDLPPEVPARILLLGCGDPRNVLYTIVTEGPEAKRPLDFTCCDIDPGVLARNVLLFSMIADNVPTSTIWNIFYHFRLDAQSHTTLIDQCKKLIDLTSTAQKWRESAYGNSMKMSTDYTLSELRRHWELYVATTSLPAQRLQAIDAEFTAIWKSNTNAGSCSTAVRSVGPPGLHAWDVLVDSLKTYWKSGTTYTDGKNLAAATILNPTFIYSLAGEGCNVHYGTDPLTPFHLAPTFANSKPPSYPDVVKAVRAEFSDWCASYRSALSVGSTPVVRFIVGEATSTCRAIKTFDSTGVLSAGIPVAQWKTQLIQLSRAEYIDGPNPAPTTFDVIHTSNLEDHIGLLNVLIPAVPLLSPEPSSVLYTESLLALDSEPTKEFIEHLKGDITVMALLFGVCPTDYLCGFTTRSNMHDIINVELGPKKKKNAPTIRQFQQIVTWRSSASADTVAAAVKALPPSFDASQMAAFFYDLYQALFAKESAMNFWGPDLKKRDMLRAVGTSNLTAHYTREAFVLIMKQVKDRLQPHDGDWKDTVSRFDARLLDTWSPQNMETMHYQDLCGQLRRYGLYKASSFTPSARKIGPFAGWGAIPDLIRIVLVVPRSELHVMEKGNPDEIGTPPLQCEIHGHRTSNLFTSLHAAFGRAVSVGAKDKAQVVFEEDIKGWKGTSPLVLSFVAPSYLLTELETPHDISISLGVRNTPAVCMTLIGKLGIHLRISTAKLMDSSLVYVLAEPPLPPRLLRADKASSSNTSDFLRPTFLSQLGTANRAAMEFDEDCEHIQSLGIRVDLTDAGSLKIFSAEGGKAVPTIEQTSACVIRITLGERTQDIVYPFPVIGSQHRLRLARKSQYIEVLVPPSRSLMEDGMKFNPYPVVEGGSTIFPWSLHRVNPSTMPIVNLNAKGVDKWLNPHVGSMMSTRERKLRKKRKHDALMFVKDTIHVIFVKAAGIQPPGSPRKRLFSLVDEKTNNCDTILFISDLRFDLASHTVICDGYVLPLTKAFLASTERAFGKLVHQGDMVSIPVFEGEMQGWKQLLPALVERCRTGWTHGPNCEYKSVGRVPLSEAMETVSICSCGQGKAVEGMAKGPELWKPFAKYVTRIALAPLFAVSYLESVGRATGGAGRKCCVCRKVGEEGKVKTCSGCKKVRYCSDVCQKKDWKAHKPKCKA